MAAVFSDKVEVVEASHAAEIEGETLHAKIGQFVVERGVSGISCSVGLS